MMKANKKKPSLPPEDLNNYRPISNLNFISKILEKVVASRMNSHLSTNSLFLPFQSAYRSFHFTESTLLKIHNDIISSIDNGKQAVSLKNIISSYSTLSCGEVTALILLDLSAAFDTVDHSILLSRLKNWFGFYMSLTSQVNLVCKSSHFHIRDIRRIRNLIPLSIAITLANSLVSSRLDYCNSLYFGMSKQNIQKLQRVQNSPARAITQTSKYQHITPVLKDLHWLPITQRIGYKIYLLTFETFMNGQPSYLHQYLIPQTHYSSTRSSQTSALFIPRTRTSTGKRAFPVAAPRIWNSLPADVRTTTSVSSYRSINSKLTSSKLPFLPRLFSFLLD